jgi:hypothetical protein
MGIRVEEHVPSITRGRDVFERGKSEGFFIPAVKFLVKIG